MSSPPLPSDGDLVAAARDGDGAAWEALVDRHDRLLRSVCRHHRLSDADAADVKQTTWLRAFEHIDRLQQPERLGAWLATVARNECLRVLRRADRLRPCEDERLLDPAGATSEAADASLLAHEREDAVRGAVIALPARDRTLLRLLYSDAEPSYSEISRTLGMPIGSIGPTRGRVLERMRRHAPLARLAAA
jgi:RNA polymerase sigma factor (sigma-70 family)